MSLKLLYDSGLLTLLILFHQAISLIFVYKYTRVQINSSYQVINLKHKKVKNTIVALSEVMVYLCFTRDNEIGK